MRIVNHHDDKESSQRVWTKRLPVTDTKKKEGLLELVPEFTIPEQTLDKLLPVHRNSSVETILAFSFNKLRDESLD